MSRAAIRYAKAILETAGNAAAVNADMETILGAISESDELKEFLSNPVTTSEIKLSALNEVFASVQNDTKALFRLLHENKRFEILAQVAQQYKILFDELSGTEVAVVTTAFPITAELESKVMAKIKEFSSKNIIIQNIVDPAIIGGFILRIGDRQYNASVADRLTELKRELSN
ncbi:MULTISPECIES: ATP synthase F1 subunit delta [unclassified Flavobacterium]|uniref:ATP synthase F1 subunit delta n=1 Tax=unclassified Flavobacterium TaxID=196869 RepID=UPI001F130232|nr:MULTISPECIES: ATP synthase F1 subunit delta [unclassified Flavobacterium]UMY66416.1 ATP synthase F1 subunit delta [Flavobacterium sp. HJ-32-4]